MSLPYDRTLKQLASISAEAKSGGPLTEEEWLVEVEPSPTIVAQAFWILAGGMGAPIQHFHGITTPSRPSLCARTTQ